MISMVILTPRNEPEFLKQVKALKKPRALVFVGMHEESEATARLAMQSIRGKPLHEHFREEVVFIRLKQKQRNKT